MAEIAKKRAVSLVSVLRVRLVELSHVEDIECTFNRCGPCSVSSSSNLGPSGILVLLEVVIALPSRQRPLKVMTSRGFRRRVFFIRGTVRRELTGLHPG